MAKKVRILCWNINGFRAVLKKGFLEWMKKESPDILCLQEIKAMPEQIPADALNVPGYEVHINSAKRPGYSGVLVYTKSKPLSVKRGFGIEKFDSEGRVLELEYPEFTLFNIYFPNGKMNDDRLSYKMEFYGECLSYWQKLVKKGKRLVICGDYNTAHKEIDLARPKENRNVSGFLPIECEWMDKLTSKGFIDTFRVFNQEPNNYTWWDTFTRARERNVGWRIDYHFISENLKPNLYEASILPDVMGSDHCPVGLVLRFD